jgi:hypothetical protein
MADDRLDWLPRLGIIGKIPLVAEYLAVPSTDDALFCRP